LRGERIVVSRATDVGAGALGEGATMTMTDLAVRGTRPQATDDEFGYGLVAQGPVAVDVERFSVEDSFVVGIVSVIGAVLTGADASIARVSVASCTSSTCPGRPFGFGAAALSGSIVLERFAVEDAEVCGAMIDSDSAELDLRQGVVSGAAIGACIQQSGYDVGRISDGVVYRDNGTNLDTTILPVPAPTDPVDVPER
jgi:hypothetical protein